MKDIVPELRTDRIQKLAEKGKRLDGRGLEQFREFSVLSPAVGTAEGSSRVRLGGTEVVVGVKIGLGQPYDNTPDEGMLATAVDLRQIAHHSFHPVQSRSMAVEISRVVDRGIRESGMIDLKSLCLEPGKRVWMINLDMMVLDYDGNIFDACMLGALAALPGTKVPAAHLGMGEDFPLPVKDVPVSTTFVKIGDYMMLDPNAVEEAVADARLTITTDTAGNLRAMQKGLSGVLYYEDVTKAIKDSVSASKNIRDSLAP